MARIFIILFLMVCTLLTGCNSSDKKPGIKKIVITTMQIKENGDTTKYQVNSIDYTARTVKK